MRKRIVSIGICLLVAIGMCTMLVGCGASWLSKEYDNLLETYTAEKLEVTVPKVFKKDDAECSDTVLALDFQGGKNNEPHVFITAEFLGLVSSEKSMDSYLEADEDYIDKKDEAVEISGEGYQGTEIKRQSTGSELSITSDIDYLLVDKSVFKITLTTETGYYNEGDIQLLRDHINWSEYESNIIVDIEATYDGDTYDGDHFDEEMLSVKAVLKDGSTRYVDFDNVTIKYPKGEVFKAGKTLVVEITYVEDGNTFTTTWEGEGEEEEESSYSSGSSSSHNDGSYQKGDEVAEGMDTDNDGSVSGNEFQDAVNDYMDANGY